MSPRSNQLDEVWRVAMARHTGRPEALGATSGPLSQSSLTMYLQSLKEMLRGGQYTRALKNDDTDYFLALIQRHLGQAALHSALSAMDQHITYYNALNRGELRGARVLHDRWMKQLTSPPSRPPETQRRGA